MLAPVKNFLANQARQPSGWFGRTIAPRVFNKENHAMEDFGMELLDIQSQDHVLEIGFGNGRLVGGMLKTVKNGKVYGIDLSADMVDLVNQKHQDAISEGRLALTQGSVEELPYADEGFNKIFTANTIYFWPQPQVNLREIKRTLKPGGVFACALRLKDQMEATESAFKNSVVSMNRDIFEHLYEADEVQQLFEAAGFQGVTLNKRETKQETLHVVTAIK